MRQMRKGGGVPPAMAQSMGMPAGMGAGLLGAGAAPGFGAAPGLGAVLGFEVGEEAAGSGEAFLSDTNQAATYPWSPFGSCTWIH